MAKVEATATNVSIAGSGNGRPRTTPRLPGQQLGPRWLGFWTALATAKSEIPPVGAKVVSVAKYTAPVAQVSARVPKY